MKILMIHNYYTHRGGEGMVFSDETDLLRENGYRVFIYTRDNLEIKKFSRFHKLGLFYNSHWSLQSYRDIKCIVENEKPDIAHFHNIFPLISPSVYYACQKYGVPVVQTLHNYRLICPSAVLLRDQQICEKCIGKTIPFPGIIYKCYRDSRHQSAVVASMLAFHQFLQTWKKQVNIYIALTEFSRRKLIEGGIPGDKVKVKPNFITDPGPRYDYEDYIVFIGRLSEEKGYDLLLTSLKKLPEIKLKIIGDGLKKQKIAQYLSDHKMYHIELVGNLPHTQVLDYLKKARFLVLPSKWYEGFPRVLVEALACGVPSIVSNIGSMKEIITDQYTGLHFEVNDPQDLASKMKYLWNNQSLLESLGKNARKEFIKKFTPQRNYQILTDIYQKAINKKL